MTSFKTALIVGAGTGLSASLARRFATEGIKVALAARNVEKITAMRGETGADVFTCDATDPAQVQRLFAEVDAKGGLRSAVQMQNVMPQRDGFGDPLLPEVPIERPAFPPRIEADLDFALGVVEPAGHERAGGGDEFHFRPVGR